MRLAPGRYGGGVLWAPQAGLKTCDILREKRTLSRTALKFQLRGRRLVQSKQNDLEKPIVVVPHTIPIFDVPPPAAPPPCPPPIRYRTEYVTVRRYACNTFGFRLVQKGPSLCLSHPEISTTRPLHEAGGDAQDCAHNQAKSIKKSTTTAQREERRETISEVK